MTPARLMIIIVAMAITMLLLGAACAAAPEAPQPPPGPIGQVDAGDAPAVPLSFLLRQSQAEWVAQALGPWIISCGKTTRPTGPDEGHGAHRLEPVASDYLAQNLDLSNWRVGNMRITDTTGTFGVTFTGITAGKSAFDPLLSTWTYGETSVTSNEDAELPGSAYLLDNARNDTVLDFSQDEEITLTQERSTATSKQISLDVGAKVTGSVGGEAFGAKLETEISTAFGITTDTSSAQSESMSRTTTRHIATTVEPGKASLATITASTVKSKTPFTVDGVWESGITIYASRDLWLQAGPGENNDCTRDLESGDGAVVTGCCHGNNTGGNGYVTLTWKTFSEFLSTINGVNTTWPNYNCGGTGVWKCRLDGVSQLNDHTLRSVNIDGVQQRTYQDAAEVKIVDVSGQDTNKLIEDHGIDNNRVVRGTDQAPKLAAEPPALGAFNAPQGAVPRFAVAEDGVYVLGDDGVIRRFDLVGELSDFTVPLAYTE